MEVWKVIPSAKEYAVSNLGRVKRIAKRRFKLRKRVLTPFFIKGYPNVTIPMNGEYKKRKVHRLMMEAFLGLNPIQVNHKNGNRSDNRISNLEPCTPQENIIHAVKVLGTIVNPKCENHPMAKLTNKQVIQIRSMEGTQREIAKRFGVCQQVISRIKARKGWFLE